VRVARGWRLGLWRDFMCGAWRRRFFFFVACLNVGGGEESRAYMTGGGSVGPLEAARRKTTMTSD
jgi:hypothetical protein